MSLDTMSKAIAAADQVFGLDLPTDVAGILAEIWGLPVTTTPDHPVAGQPFTVTATRDFALTPTVSVTFSFKVTAG